MKHFLLFTCNLFIPLTLLFAQPGSPDNTFGNNGVVKATLPLTSADDGYQATKVARLPNGKYIASVYSYAFGSADHINLYLYRFTHDGKVDSSFANGGKVLLFPGKPTPLLSALATDASNRILFTISDFDADPKADFTIARLKENGSSDSSFGKNGVLALHTTAYNSALGDALTVLPDGKILTACSGESNGPKGTIKCVLFKFNPNGTPDKSFNGIGYASFSPVATGGGGGDAFTSSRPLALQRDGGILVSYIDIVRFRADGSRDMSFGSNGFVTPKLNNSHIENFHNLAAYSDGSFLVGGSWVNYGNDGGYATQNIYKYTKSGKPDPLFGTGGVLTLHNNERFYEIPPASGDINVQPDNRFVLIDVPPASEFDHTDKITKFLSDGRIDSSFAANGSIVAPTADNSSLVTADILLQPDSKILALRFPFNDNTQGNGDFYLYRYNNDTALPFAGKVSEDNNAAIRQTNNNSLAAALSLVLFPNPVTDKITITGLNAGKMSHIVIYDMQGKVLSQASVSSAQVSLPVTQLKAGMYRIIINQDNKIISRQSFVKQ